MLRFAFAWLAALALAGCGQDAPPPAPQQSAIAPALWEIRDGDGALEGWLFGTIHALPDGIQWETTEIAETIRAADLLVVEIADPESIGAPSATFVNLAYTFGQPPVLERVDEDYRIALQRQIERSGRSEAELRVLETWALALALSKGTGVGDPANGADRTLVAAFSDREVRELEGLEAQLALFDRLPEDDQRALLQGVLEETEAQRRDPARLTRAWLAGDIDTLAGETHRGILADPELREALLAGRNRAWAGTIEAMLTEDDLPLIAVGAAHLAGPDGLPVLLRGAGYAVERVQ